MWTIKMQYFGSLSAHSLTPNIHKLIRRQYAPIVFPFITNRFPNYQFFHNYFSFIGSIIAMFYNLTFLLRVSMLVLLLCMGDLMDSVSVM